MSGVSGRPSVTGVATAMTRVAPDAFRRAEAVRGVGLVLTGALSVLGGSLPAVAPWGFARLTRATTAGWLLAA